MITTVGCPYCKKSMCILNSTEMIDLICSGCNARYLASFVVLTGVSLVEQFDSNAKNIHHIHQIYDLRVLAQDKAKSIHLVLSSQNSILSLTVDDRLLLLYLQHSCELALVINLTVNWEESLIPSYKNHTSAMIGIAAVIVVGGYLLGANVLQNFFPAKISPFLGIGIAAPIALVTVNKLRRPTFIEADREAITQLLYEQSLLFKQQGLQEKLERLREQMRQNVEDLERLEKLHSQLVNMPESGERLKTVGKAKTLVQEQNSILQKLISEYERIDEQVDIDFSASHLVKNLSKTQIFDKTAEMELLGCQREDLESQLQFFM